MQYTIERSKIQNFLGKRPQKVVHTDIGTMSVYFFLDNTEKRNNTLDNRGSYAVTRDHKPHEELGEERVIKSTNEKKHVISIGLGIIVSKKISKKAVVRNKIKRRIREAFRSVLSKNDKRTTKAEGCDNNEPQKEMQIILNCKSVSPASIPFDDLKTLLQSAFLSIITK